MLKLASYDIVFQEVPGEVTLALNISGCPNRCPGCHSPHLWEDIGEPLDVAMIDMLLARYGESITCVCFMGGDGDPALINRLAAYICSLRCPDSNVGTSGLRTAWYSGCDTLHPDIVIRNFDYIKIGSFRQELGGLRSPNTNQRMYKVSEGELVELEVRKEG